MKVHFIGAGPGAPDLITLRGRDLLARCPVCLYAGSLVPAALLSYCPPGARIVDTAPMVLDEIVAEFTRARERDEDVARLHSGDVSIWSAMAEQQRWLEALGIEYTVTPGVPAFAAAAAALGRELTLPEISQSLVLTRTPGRASAMPGGETLAAFAATGATLALHLSIHRLGDIVEELLPYYGPDCPAAIVYRASWPDERTVRGTLGSIAELVAAQPVERTAIIFVGRTLGNAAFRDSALYDADYHRRFRPGRRSAPAAPAETPPEPRRPGPPGLVIAAPRSGSGKTVLTLGLMRAFSRSGLRVGAAKCGPDYIDPAFHAVATGRASVNLDSWAMAPSLLSAIAAQAGEGADFILCEGSMGLFDGVPGARGRTGASADVAAAMGWPLLLVIDVSGQAQSAAAIVKGCIGYDPRQTVAGVVLNRVGSLRHQRLVTDPIEAMGLKVLGALPRSDAVALPERHLGLVQASETANLDKLLDAMADFVVAHVDLAAVRAAAKAAPLSAAQPFAIDPPGQRIAIARDRAFTFLYPHITDGWRHRGAEIRYFSPLADEAPPADCDVCWLPGGYPELHAGQLAGANAFLAGLVRFARTKPVHGECGGYMVLGEVLTDAAGTPHRMAGLLGLATSFASRKLHLGYRRARLAAACPLGRAGTDLLGHEFHYATIADAGTDEPFAFVTDAYGAPSAPAGSRRGAVTGSFFHVIARAG